MTENHLAIIDMGTNTFHLLVVEILDSGWREVHRERVFVNLAQGGINRIGDRSWARALNAVESFAQYIDQHSIRHVRAVGTSALRNAENAQEFISLIDSKFGIRIEVIDGLQEASYIYKGVVAAAKPVDPVLVMDIGGGSVEFCIVADGKNVFNGSFQVGVAVLYDRFHKSEPISSGDLNAMERHLDSMLGEVFSRCENYPGIRLIGASGSFEVLDKALHDELNDSAYITYPTPAFLEFYKGIIPLNLEERFAHPHVPRERARYIVCALHLIYYLVHRLDLDTIGISSYAMKEGIAVDFIDNLD